MNVMMKKKKMFCMIVFLGIVSVFSASIALTEETSTTADNTPSHRTPEAQNPLTANQKAMIQAVDMVFDFLESLSDYPVPATHPPGFGIVNTDAVNIRQHPGLKDKIVCRIVTKGAIVKILESRNGWMRVSLNGCRGWVNEKYLFTGLTERLKPQKTVPSVLEKKKRQAIEFIRRLRWGRDNKNYFRIISLDGKMILEPLYPQLEGKDSLSFEDQNHREVFAEMIKICREREQGFVRHQGIGYDGNRSKTQVSFVKLFKPWGWIVGTDVELNAVEAYEAPEAPVFNIELPPINDEQPASSK